MVNTDLAQFMNMMQLAYQLQTTGQNHPQLMKSLHTKAPGNTNAAQLLGQPGGLFSIAGLDRNVISLHVAPQGLGAELPVITGSIDDPRFGFLVGWAAETGSRPVNPCDDGPKGTMTAGTLTASFGRILHQTNTIEIDKLLHDQRGVTANLQLMNAMLNDASGFSPANASGADVLNLVVRSEMVGVGVQFERDLSKLIWRGTAANNTAGGGHKEFPGLDLQVATGQLDAETGNALSAADSLILDFEFDDVNGTTKDIVKYLSYMEYYQRHLATRQGLDPVEWVFVMRPELWFEVSAIWPCRYLTDRCSSTSTTGVTNGIVLNDRTAVQMRDQMREGMFIDVNGRRYRVITDDGIYEKNNTTDAADVPSGSYASPIYMLPLRIKGGFPVLYWEHIDYRRVSGQIAALGMGNKAVPFWTENGRFLWVYRDNGYCFDMQAKAEPRVVLRTPHLAAKLEDVLYTPLLDIASPYPGEATFRGGGETGYAGTTGSAVWVP